MTPDAAAASDRPDMIGLDQRWKDRRESYRGRADLFNPAGFSVAAMTGDRAARDFVEEHHYSGSYPAAKFRVGLYGPAATPAGPATLFGVAVFSVPMTQTVIPAWCAVTPNEGVELGRFVLLPEVGFNGETWFLRRAMALLSDVTGVRRVVSFSDPVPRRNADGVTVKPGHIGQIYQALGAVYMGRTKARYLVMAPDGSVLSERSLSKIRNAESGWEGSVRHLLSAGADPRRAGEEPDVWLRRVITHFPRLKHPGNHGYVFAIDRSQKYRTRAYSEMRDRRGQPPPRKTDDAVEVRHVGN